MHTRTCLYSAIIIAAFAIVLMSCGDDDKGVDSVSFKVPGVYNGTYQIINGWFHPDTTNYSEYTDSVIFDFKSNGTFDMKVSESEVETYFCHVHGTYSFAHDTLYLDTTNTNVDQDICSPQNSPAGAFSHYVIGNQLIFDIRKPAEYKYHKIALIGR